MRRYHCLSAWLITATRTLGNGHAALSRKTGQDFKQDKQAWAKWWESQGNNPIDDKFLQLWVPPPQSKE